jgi:PEP-CTERM motif
MCRSRQLGSCVAPVLIIIIALGARSAVAATVYSEDWTAGDTNGWIQNTASSVLVRDAGFGNPAGSLAVRRDLSPPIFDIGATSNLPQVSGDYTGAASWTFSFDVFYATENYVDTWLRFRYQDGTFNGWHLDVADVFPSSWQSYSVTFDSTWSDVEAAAHGWVDETGGTVPWTLLMTNVFHPEIRLLLGDDASALAYIDNVAVRSIPEPASLALLALGFLGLGCTRRRKR